MARRRKGGRASAIKAKGQELRDAARLDVPWARWLPMRMAREGFLSGLLDPLMSVYTRRRSKRREVLSRLRGPVVFVANHSSHMDTPVILRALPRRWRSRTAVAAAADYFYSKRRIAIAVSLVFGTVPIARCGGGAGRDSLDLLDRLIRKRWSVLMYPEGTRSRDGSLNPLRSGAVVLAARRHVPIVPISVSGTNAAMPPGRAWPRRIRRGLRSTRHDVEVTFGDPIVVESEADLESVKERVHAFFERQRGLVDRVRRGDDAKSDPQPAAGPAPGVDASQVMVHPPATAPQVSARRVAGAPPAPVTVGREQGERAADDRAARL